MTINMYICVVCYFKFLISSLTLGGKNIKNLLEEMDKSENGYSGILRWTMEVWRFLNFLKF